LAAAKRCDQGKESKLKYSKIHEALAEVCSGKEHRKEKFRKNAVKGYS